MACVADTTSIDLDVAGGILTAEAIIDPKADVAGVAQVPNPLSVDADGLFVYGADGWLALPTALAYSSADGPTFIATTSNDLRAFITPGDKIKLTQTTAKYFLVTAIAAGTITLYGGTDYTLTVAAITAPYFSKDESPVGFPLDEAKWSELYRDTTVHTQTNPTGAVWYWPAGVTKIDVPIGDWSLEYSAMAEIDTTAATVIVGLTLSTANNAESDVDFTGAGRLSDGTSNAKVSYAQVSKRKPILRTSKQTYYLLVRSGVTIADGGGVSIDGADAGSTVIRAVSRYL